MYRPPYAPQFCLLLFGLAAFANDAVPPSKSATSALPARGASKLYVLGPDDQIILQGPNAEELVNKPARLDANGDVTFPFIGSVHAGGLTVRDFERTLNDQLRTYLRNPQITVNISEYRSQPVSVVG